jgi:hypothetical protein
LGAPELSCPADILNLDLQFGIGTQSRNGPAGLRSAEVGGSRSEPRRTVASGGERLIQGEYRRGGRGPGDRRFGPDDLPTRAEQERRGKDARHRRTGAPMAHYGRARARLTVLHEIFS